METPKQDYTNQELQLPVEKMGLGDLVMESQRLVEENPSIFYGNQDSPSPNAQRYYEIIREMTKAWQRIPCSD